MSQGEECFTPQSVWQVYKVPLILGFFSFLFIVLSITIYIKSYQEVAPIRFSSDSVVASISGVAATQEALLFVDIEGAVKKPGVYRLARDARVEDLLTIAGGFAHDVDVVYVGQSINRAAKLSDGAKIYIPRIGEVSASDNQGSISDQSKAQGAMININSASKSELEALSGVGPVTAEKIIGGRPYMRLEELTEKKVLGQSVFDNVKNQLSL